MFEKLRDSSGMHRITWSIMNKWLTCRRSWYYRYYAGITNLPGTALRFGNLIHAMMEQEAISRMQWDKTFENAQESQITNDLILIDSAIDRAEKTSQKACMASIQEASRFYSLMLPDEMEKEIYEEGVLAQEVYVNWIKQYGLQDLQNYRVIDVETYLEMPLQSPGKRASNRWIIGGKVDAIVQCKRTGKTYIREYKTTGGACTQYERRLELDPQVRIYAMILEALGRPVDGVQYIVLRRKIPNTPQMINCRSCKGSGMKAGPEALNKTYAPGCSKCRGQGKIPSKSKQLDSVQPVVVEFLMKGGWNLTEYQELIQTMQGWEKFISFNQRFIEQSELSDVKGEIWRVAHEISKATRIYNKNRKIDLGMVFPRNTSNCSGPTGSCVYRELCVGGVRAEEIGPNDGWLIVPDSPELEQQDK